VSWGFTHVDPFEDTESPFLGPSLSVQFRFTHVDPFEDTESPGRDGDSRFSRKSFTHVDPFEDTERSLSEA